MATELSICNKALARVGVSTFIDSRTEDSTEAAACDELFDDCRDEVLEGFPWPFATRRATLVALDGVTRDGWTYVYTLPEDCLAARALWPGTRTPRPEEVIPFGIEANDAADGSVLCSDFPSAPLIYTAQITNPTLFSPLFASALAWKLAAEVALSLKLKLEVWDRASKMYEIEVSKAGAAALNEGAEARPDSQFISVRE